MEQLLLIFSNLIFLVVGWFFGRQHQIRNVDIGKKILAQAKKLPVKAGIIEYVTQEDIDYRESGEEKVDEAREKLFKEQFKS